MLRSASAFLVSLALISFALTGPLVAAEKRAKTEIPKIEIKEWPLPWPDAKPADPHAAGTESVWFAAQSGNFLGRLNTQTARFSRVDLVDAPAPRGLIVGSGANGLVWYSGSAHGYIGRYDPRTRTLSRFPMTNDAAGDPSALAWEAGERNIWFTVEQANIVGRYRLVNSIVDMVGLTTPHAVPSDVAMAPKAGNPWFALSGTNKLATIDIPPFTLTEFALPRTEARPRQIAFTSDGRLWYTDFAGGYLGVFTTTTHATKEWPMPGGTASHPYALAVDSQNRIWSAETGTKPGKLVGFDPKTQQFFDSTPIPSGGSVVSKMNYDPSSGKIWFATDANTIGYAQVDQPPKSQ